MPDREETRLLAACKKYWRLRLAASSALTHPIHSVFYGSDAHRQLIDTNATAHAQYVASRLALRSYRSNMKPKANGAGA